MLASEGHRIFSIELAREFSSRVGLNAPYLTEALYHLRRNRWIVPLRRGLYAISLPGAVPIHEFEIAMALVHPAAISHWSAMHHHNLTEQIPRRVFVSTTQGSAPRVASTTCQFVQVKPEHFFGAEQIWIGEARVSITDLERTLVDGLWMPRYCGDFAEVLHAFEVAAAHLDLDKIVGYALRLGGTIAKRLGWVLEQQGIGLDRLLPLQRAPIKGYRKLDPSGPRKGPYRARWMIQENLPGKLRG
ncbi:MAG: hypothetical protein ABSG65_36715 [Bryobacteraceae bacterium]|jgi:predicted transcriptional regulator of viral defense system